MRLIKRSIEILNSSKRVADAIHKISGYSSFMTFLDILRARLLYGASEEDYIAMEFYRKSHNEQKQFNTYRRNFVEFFNAFYDDKAVKTFDKKEYFLKEFSSMIKHDYLFTGDASIDELNAFIHEHGSVIVKPNDGCEGVGVFKLEATDKVGIDKLLKDIFHGKKYVIEELVIQHPKMSALNPSSVNTIRVETIIDGKGKVHITNTICIMGTSDSVVNNTHNGGIMCHIEPDTGILDSFARNPRGERFFRCPSTNIILPGYQLPNWDGILEFAKKLAYVVPSARKIGWDIVILEDGYDVIEGNVRPGHCTQACDMKPRYYLEKGMI